MIKTVLTKTNIFLKKRPCRKHKLAFPDSASPEVMGVAMGGRSIYLCGKCGWLAEDKR